MNRLNSEKLFEKAKQLMPGGVNSPVRAFKAVGGNPIFMKSAKGAYMTDADGNQYIDLINSWGPMLLGHANEKIEKAVSDAIKDSLSFGTPSWREVEMAELIIAMVPCIEKVRMVNSGTEATMAAIRVARGFTKREKIIKFEGCYHGHGDSFLIAAGSGAVTMGFPDSLGVTQGVANDTLTAIYNDIENVKQLVEANPNNIAAIIIEPVVGNMGCVPPNQGFLQALRDLCTQNSIVLIFDEVMTGFRLAKGGAQELFGITPDLCTLGKIIGGGMPVGAYGGKKEIMDIISPLGPVYQAGTLSGNPIAMAAGLAMLHSINEDSGLYSRLNETTTRIVNGIKEINKKLGKNYTINQVGSMYTLFFTEQQVQNFSDAKTSDTVLFGEYFKNMLNYGIYLAPSQYESLFVSNSIGATEVKSILSAHETSIKAIL